MGLRLKWSLRDLRARALQVAAIALIIAIGTGLYAGLSSSSRWRTISYDASYEQSNMYDLRVALTIGSYVDSERLVAVARAIPHAGSIRQVEPRLVEPTQVDASRAGKTVLVPGRLVGVDVGAGGPAINRVSATQGRTLRAGDDGRSRAVVDAHFAEHYDLPGEGRIDLRGQPVEYVGHGLSPEYFMVIGERGSILAEANYAVVFVPLGTAQRLTGKAGLANDLVLTLDPDADSATVRRELGEAVRTAFPGVGSSVNARRGDVAYRTLYDDIEGDQRFYNIFAVLILAGAAFAAFNLTGRIVEAQRREIGIGMALGVRPASLALRPLLVGAEVALLGIAFGVVVGLGVSAYMASLLRGFFPLPEWHTSFQVAVFGRAAAIGFLLPLLATLFPVWRAVRVAPVEAIHTGSTATSGGLAPLLARVPVPGRATAQMPLRNVLRTPRRTLMTALGIAAVIVVLIGVIGMVDSFTATLDRGEQELERSSPDRLSVQLDSFYPESAAPVAAIGSTAGVRRAEPILQVPGRLEVGDTDVDVVVDLVDLDGPIWRPTVRGRRGTQVTGIVLSEAAARDLGVEPGDAVTLRHPRRTGAASYEYVRSSMPVLGLNPLPLRAAAFMDRSSASLLGLEGATNTVIAEPGPGVAPEDVQRALFGRTAVASVQRVTAYTDTIRDELEQVLGVLTVVELAVLLLALLIAFNSASINADERVREEATMFAFGVRVRTVLRIGTVESLVIGVIGTTTGLALGWLLLDWLVTELIPQTFPDLGIVTDVSPRTWITAVVFGVVAVAVAPLFTVRKLWRMDVPSALRVVE